MRKVVVAGVLGGLPGLLIALVPLLLHGLDVISSDQSQIGFIGVPLLILGTAIGLVTAASGGECAGAAVAGVVVGFGLGVLGTALSTAARVGLGLALLFVIPLGMIAGAAIGVALCGRRRNRT